MLFCPAIKSDQTGHQASQRTSVRLTDQAQGSSPFASSQDGCGATTRRASVTALVVHWRRRKGFSPEELSHERPPVTTTVKVDRSGPSGNRICYPSVKYAHDRDIAYST